jgi:integrase
MKDWTQKQVLAAAPGRHCIGKSLYVYVAPDRQTRRFMFRYTKPSTGRVTETGLGTLDDDITLAEAHEKRDEYRRLVRRGGDPVEQKREAKIEANREAEAQRTFGSVTEDFIAVQERRFRNPGSAKDMRRMLRNHASPLAGKPMAEISATHIKAALLPLWQTSPEQTRRTVGMVLRVFRYAKASGLAVANPADLRDALKELLPRVNGTKRHFTALPYKNISAFVRELRVHQRRGDAMLPSAIEFLVLTAARESEVCGMRWSEISWEENLWIAPAVRSKTAREHRVPLSDRAVALLLRQRGSNSVGFEPDPDGFIWPGQTGDSHIAGKSLYKYATLKMGVQTTIHGLRSSFRDWAGDMTHHARSDIEECLGHAVGNAVERAYRRSDALEKRREILAAWERYCEGR